MTHPTNSITYRYGRKRNGIKKELSAKVNNWLGTIKDENARKVAKDNVIITGGAIASMLLGEKVNDFDLYFRTKHATKTLAIHYVNQYNKKHKVKTKSGVNSYKPHVCEEKRINSRGDEEERIIINIKSAGATGESQSQYAYFENQSPEQTEEFTESVVKSVIDSKRKNLTKGEKYKPIFMTDNAITLSGKIQLIIRFYGSPDQIHDNYDFVHARCYYDHSLGKLKIPAEAMESMMSRHLIYTGSLYPIASIFRMKKFIERGWRITTGQQLKIMWQISELNLRDVNTIKDQLIGVDFAYMQQLIEIIQSLSASDINKVDSSYIATLIDKIFD